MTRDGWITRLTALAKRLKEGGAVAVITADEYDEIATLLCTPRIDALHASLMTDVSKALEVHANRSGCGARGETTCIGQKFPLRVACFSCTAELAAKMLRDMIGPTPQETKQ